MQEAPDLVTFPEKIISRKLHILCSEKSTECTKFMCQIFFYPKNSYSNSFLLSLLTNADMTEVTLQFSMVPASFSAEKGT